MSDPAAQPPAPACETDERFPSGRWTGFWLQPPVAGRQYMSLHLTFAESTVSGHGSDVIGDFTVAGAYDLRTGQCKFRKAYVGQHTVEYDGCNQGDGMWIWGLWTIGSIDRGGFHIWPHGEPDPTGRRLESRADLPAESEADERRVLVPAVGEPEESAGP